MGNNTEVVTILSPRDIAPATGKRCPWNWEKSPPPAVFPRNLRRWVAKRGEHGFWFVQNSGCPWTNFLGASWLLLQVRICCWDHDAPHGFTIYKNWCFVKGRTSKISPFHGFGSNLEGFYKDIWYLHFRSRNPAGLFCRSLFMWRFIRSGDETQLMTFKPTLQWVRPFMISLGISLTISKFGGEISNHTFSNVGCAEPSSLQIFLSDQVPYTHLRSLLGQLG